jgi:hypothetical protein
MKMGLGYETEHPFDDFPDAQTSTMPRDMQPVSIETLKKAMKELELLPKPDQWLVVDPHGSDLSCYATREMAIDAAIKEAQS